MSQIVKLSSMEEEKKAKSNKNPVRNAWRRLLNNCVMGLYGDKIYYPSWRDDNNLATQSFFSALIKSKALDESFLHQCLTRDDLLILWLLIIFNYSSSSSYGALLYFRLHVLESTLHE